jgi:predicted nucleotidyltransferase
VGNIIALNYISPVVADKVQTALRTVSRFAPMAGAYLFGSQVEGRADEWSDIDLAVFASGVEDWDIHEWARISALVQREAGDDVEPHFFPTGLLENRDSAGFAAWMINRGIGVDATIPSA